MILHIDQMQELLARRGFKTTFVDQGLRFDNAQNNEAEAAIQRTIQSTEDETTTLSNLIQQERYDVDVIEGRLWAFPQAD